MQPLSLWVRLSIWWTTALVCNASLGKNAHKCVLSIILYQQIGVIRTLPRNNNNSNSNAVIRIALILVDRNWVVAYFCILNFNEALIKWHQLDLMQSICTHSTEVSTLAHLLKLYFFLTCYWWLIWRKSSLESSNGNHSDCSWISYLRCSAQVDNWLFNNIVNSVWFLFVHVVFVWLQ